MTRIGIIGGGQLARMLALAGIAMGMEFVFYEPRAEHCVGHLGEVVQGAYDDLACLTQFAQKVDVITYENENIAIDSIKALQEIKPLHPNSDALYYAQDRALEKQLFNDLNIPVTPSRLVNDATQLQQAANELSLPIVLKSRRGGYDGKHQWIIREQNELNDRVLAPGVDYIAEKFMPFSREVSITAARDTKGNIKAYPLAENIHHQGILKQTTVKMNDPLFEAAQKTITTTMEALNYIGVLTIEFFVVEGELFVNEMAPRVHNSGHWTINGAPCSQFENHLRAICSLPLGDTQAIKGEIVMTNIISHWPDKALLMNSSNLHLHDYQKSERLNRKLGHYTVINYNKQL